MSLHQRRVPHVPPAASAWSPPPLLLLQVVVASLLSLKVQLGVLQLGSQALALLLQLLQCPLALLAVRLQVCQLRAEVGRQSELWDATMSLLS